MFRYLKQEKEPERKKVQRGEHYRFFETTDVIIISVVRFILSKILWRTKNMIRMMKETDIDNVCEIINENWKKVYKGYVNSELLSLLAVRIEYVN